MNVSFLGLFDRDVGIDLGTVNTLIARKDRGIILRESSAVALDHEKRIVAVGEEALALLGRTPGAVKVVHPLQDGVVADLHLCECMLRHFIEKSMGRAARRAGIRAVLCVPGCITDVEKRALEEAARGAGARAAFIIDEPIAAALGAGLPVDQPIGSLVVDIGGGTTDAAVLALGGIVQKHSVRAGGTHINAAIMQHIRNVHGLSIGQRAAEELKLELGTARPGPIRTKEIRGRDHYSGLPRTVDINSMELYRAIQPQLNIMLNCVREVLTATPPELSGDIYEQGMWLTGGGALLNGIADFFAAETGIHTFVAANPLYCVAEGARIAVENLSYYKSRAV